MLNRLAPTRPAAAAVVTALTDALVEHTGSRQPRDDVTIVCAVNTS